MTDQDFMREALIEAQKAFDQGEVPLGAVIVRNGKIIARNHNRREEQADPTAHAEVLVIREAGRAYGAHDSKAGAVHSLYQVTEDDRLNHRLEVTSGILAQEAADLMRKFFHSRR